MIAFDILGEMAFGESFGCIDQGSSVTLVSVYTEISHASVRNTSSVAADDCKTFIFHYRH